MSARTLLEKKLVRDDPVLRASIQAIVKAYQDIFENDLHCIVLCGSVLKEDFIPDYSDADIHVYVADAVLEERGSPQFDYAIRFQAAIGRLKPRDAGVSQFQVSFISSQKDPDWNPPIAGTYVALYGTEVPAMQMHPLSEYLEKERCQLSRVVDVRLALLRRFADKSDTAGVGIVRLMGTELKGLLYALCALVTQDPIQTFRSPLSTVRKNLSGIPDLSSAQEFFKAVREWKKIETDPEKMREAFSSGIKALKAIENWQVNRQTEETAKRK